MKTNKKTKTKHIETTFDSIFKSIANGITGIWVFVTLVVFPLYTHDMYFDILGARYNFYKISIIIQVVLLLFLLFVYVFIDGKERGFYGVKSFFNAFHPKNIFTTLRLTDWFFIVLVIVFICSYFFSNYKAEAWSGNQGRYQGLECWLFYFVSYILVTRTFKFRPFYLDWTALAGAFVCLWGILDFYFLDPFGFFKNVNFMQQLMFASSIGNYNTFTNYVGMIIALTLTLFCSEKKIWKSIIYGIILFIAVDAAVTGSSDNAALSILVILAILPFYCFKDRRGLGRYFIFAAIIMLAISFTRYTMILLPDKNHYAHVNSLFGHICYMPSVFPITAVVVLIAVVANILIYKTGEMKITTAEIDEGKTPLDLALPKFFIIIWLGLMIAGFFGVVFILLDVNVWHNFPKLRESSFSNFLIFNDDWGTHRGHNWRIAFEAFSKFPLVHKLFGHGPETYLIVSEQNAYKEMVEKYGEVYDSAHNEYIHYLVCEGILGLLSYLGFFISGIVRAFKVALSNQYVMACIFAVMTYLLQAVVNIAIPITTPVFFTLFYVAIAYMNEIEIEQVKNGTVE